MWRTGRVCVSHSKFGWLCGKLDGQSGAISLDNGTVLSASEVHRVLWFYEEEFRLQLKWQHQMSQMQVTTWNLLQQIGIIRNFERERLRAGGAQPFAPFRSVVTRKTFATGMEADDVNCMLVAIFALHVPSPSSDRYACINTASHYTATAATRATAWCPWPAKSR